MKKLLILTLVLLPFLLLTGCTSTNSYLDSINFNELTNLIDSKETFILEVYQDGCSHCSVFNPRFKSVLNEYKVNAKAINVSNLSEKEFNEFDD
jgi:thioredoxin-related protein